MKATQLKFFTKGSALAGAVKEKRGASFWQDT